MKVQEGGHLEYYLQESSPHYGLGLLHGDLRIVSIHLMHFHNKNLPSPTRWLCISSCIMVTE
jgi:hypothetical protein